MKYSTLWLSLLAAMSAQAAESVTEVKPEENLYAGYSLWDAKPAKTKKWECEGCEQPAGWVGEMGVGVGYGDNDGATRFNNWVPTQSEQGMAGIFNADARLQGEGSHYTKLKAKDVGLERFGLGIETGQYDGLRLKVGYSETPYYWSNNGKTAYHGSDNLLQAGSLDTFDKEVTRKKVTAALAYTPNSAWRPHASFSHEVKDGTLSFFKNTVPGITGPGLVPKPIESSETTLLKTGVSYLADQWLVDVSYDGSLFRNQDAALYYRDSGGQNEYAYEPDNDFHQLALSGQYQLGNHFFNARVLGNRATSSGSFNAFTASTPKDGFEGKVDTFQADGRWVGRINQKLTLRANAEYRDRNDKSDRTEAVFNSSDVKNTDRNHTKAGIAADYRLARGLKLTGGYDYLAQSRETAERTDVDESTLYVKTSYRPAAAWQFDTKLAYSSRNGSDWSHDDGSNGNGPTLRPFYLADRDRTELSADLSYQITDDLDTTANVWWAQDEYVEGNIGRSEGEDYGYDLGLNYRMSDRTNGHVFLNQQRTTSTQNHANSSDPTFNPYHTDIADKATTVGVGVSHKTESDIELGLDYSYSYGKGETNASAGSDYADNVSKQHRVELYSTYPLSKTQSLRWDMRYESFEGEDFLLTGQEANLGDLNDDYNAYFTSVSWLYKF